jgi:hypothetical protein
MWMNRLVRAESLQNDHRTAGIEADAIRGRRETFQHMLPDMAALGLTKSLVFRALCRLRISGQGCGTADDPLLHPHFP